MLNLRLFLLGVESWSKMEECGKMLEKSVRFRYHVRYLYNSPYNFEITN